MRSWATVALPVVLLSQLVVPAAFGQQISDALRVSQQGLQFNAHALAMGNAYTTIGYDVSALQFNPATMAVSPKFSWSVTANAQGFRSTTDYYGNRTDFRTSTTSSGQAGLTLPWRLDSLRTVVLGFAYTQSKDFNSGLRYKGLNDGSLFPAFAQVLADRGDPTARALGLSYATYDGSGNFLGDRTILTNGLYESGDLLAGGALTNYSFGAAIEATRGVFVGASGSYITGSYTSDLELTALDPNDVYPTGVQTVPGDPRTDGFESAQYRLVRDNQYRGWDTRFGIMFNLYDFIGLSASFHAPGPTKVSEATFTGGTTHFAGGQSLVVPHARTSSRYYFTPPTEMTVGAMANLWIVTGTAQLTYVDYTSMRLTSGEGDVPDRTEINKRINEELAPVTNLNLGAEVRLPFTGLSARAGGIYQPSPYRDDPGRFARKAVTLGAGYNANNVAQVDLGYAYAWRGENSGLQSGDGSTTDRTLAFNTLLFTIRVAY